MCLGFFKIKKVLLVLRGLCVNSVVAESFVKRVLSSLYDQ